MPSIAAAGGHHDAQSNHVTPQLAVRIAAISVFSAFYSANDDHMQHTSFSFAFRIALQVRQRFSVDSSFVLPSTRSNFVLLS